VPDVAVRAMQLLAWQHWPAAPAIAGAARND
jgi:hypothetical protein